MDYLHLRLPRLTTLGNVGSERRCTTATANLLRGATRGIHVSGTQCRVSALLSTRDTRGTTGIVMNGIATRVIATAVIATIDTVMNDTGTIDTSTIDTVTTDTAVADTAMEVFRTIDTAMTVDTAVLTRIPSHATVGVSRLLQPLIPRSPHIHNIERRSPRRAPSHRLDQHGSSPTKVPEPEAT